ncbi:hypothetical protein D0962_20600 [Leptolyngbyaceae cyanobacterium CCMR0082]|uniref:RepB/MobA-like C-terminal domain-containing protein n=1 Tax=Adonisia turfae CCMR0082 TaxID=2304604 RepID=A0A6M0S9J3_9CYAN|nr:hypothetical protein [Adonisia turfae]NEZ65145.1 hypothetical protein [Adonisia turfae CCMR0082]
MSNTDSLWGPGLSSLEQTTVSTASTDSAWTDNPALTALQQTSIQQQSLQNKNGLTAEQRQVIHQRLATYRQLDPVQHADGSVYRGQDINREFQKAWAASYWHHRQHSKTPIAQADLDQFDREAAYKLVAAGHTMAAAISYAGEKAVESMMQDSQAVAAIETYRMQRQKFGLQGDHRLQTLAIATRYAAIESTNSIDTPGERYRSDWQARGDQLIEDNPRRDVELAKDYVGEDSDSVEAAAKMLAAESPIAAYYHRPFHQRQYGLQIAITAHAENISRTRQEKSIHQVREEVYLHSATQQRGETERGRDQQLFDLDVDDAPMSEPEAMEFLVSKGETQEWKDRISDSYKALCNDRDSSLSKGHTGTEMQKEYGRRLERDGSDKGLADGVERQSRHLQDGKKYHITQTDRSVAVRLYLAGHSRQAIASAMYRRAPSCANLSKQEFQRYFNRQIQPRLNSPNVQKEREKLTAYKAKHGIPNERRLDKLNLATKREEFSKQRLQEKQQVKGLQRLQAKSRERSR